jgi:hypothetical protein
MRLFEIQLNMSSAYHPQTDAQMKQNHQCLKNYLHGMLLDKPKNWTTWLPLFKYYMDTLCLNHPWDILLRVTSRLLTLYFVNDIVP